MATGDQSDILSRLQSYLPRGWFGDWSEAPYITAVLTGIASVFVVTYNLIQYALAQARLGTSSGVWVDLWAQDFFGSSLPRNPSESDASYIARIQSMIFMPAGSRPAMTETLTVLTGRVPVIFEPNRPLDTGSCGGTPGINSFCGVARMGSLVPYMALITAYRPLVTGGSAGAAYANAPSRSALNTSGTLSYTGSLADEISVASDSSIYAAINATRPIGTNVGVCVSN